MANGKQRTLVAEELTHLEGVKGVANMIEVLPSRLADDDKLIRRVSSAIARNHKINNTRILARAINGVVHLTGFAHTVEEKWLAETEARQTPGARGVTNRIVVAPALPPKQDIQTIGEILLTFSHCLGLDLSELAVGIREGVVRLEGTVPDEHFKLAAERLARRTPNVGDVVNELRVSNEKP